MNAYDVVLFVHLATLLAAFLLSGALHASEYLRAGCTTVGELRRVSRPLRFAPAFGAVVLLLVGTGMSLVGQSEDRFDVGDPFAWTALVVLVLLALDGPLVLGRHAGRLMAALDGADAAAPVPPAGRALSFDLPSWRVSHANTAVVLAVVYNMANKPSAAVCVADVVGAALAGALVGQVLAGRGAATAASGASATA